MVSDFSTRRDDGFGVCGTVLHSMSGILSTALAKFAATVTDMIAKQLDVL